MSSEDVLKFVSYPLAIFASEKQKGQHLLPFYTVRKRGFEPDELAPLAPEASASASAAIPQ